MWGDRHFVAQSDQAKLLWCYLLTGNNDGVPGLLKGGAGAYSDAMRWSRDKAAAALDELVKSQFIEFDPAAQLLRVPNLPSYRPCSNANVLKGWYRRWKDVVESPLKYSHIESIRSAIADKKWFTDGWSETFGQIRIQEHTRQVPLFGENPENGIQRSELNENGNLETKCKPLPNGLVNKVETNITSTSTSTSNSNRNHNPLPGSTPPSEVTKAELDFAYGSYPRQSRKAEGLALAAELVTTREDFDRFTECIQFMAKAWAGKDTTYCPTFHTFVKGERWKDKEWPQPKIRKETTSGHRQPTDFDNEPVSELETNFEDLAACEEKGDFPF